MDRLLWELPAIDLQLDSDPVDPASPLQVDTTPKMCPVQDLTSSPTHAKATKPTFVVASKRTTIPGQNKNRNITKMTAMWVKRFEKCEKIYRMD